MSLIILLLFTSNDSTTVSVHDNHSGLLALALFLREHSRAPTSHRDAHINTEGAHRCIQSMKDGIGIAPGRTCPYRQHLNQCDTVRSLSPWFSRWPFIGGSPASVAIPFSWLSRLVPFNVIFRLTYAVTAAIRAQTLQQSTVRHIRILLCTSLWPICRRRRQQWRRRCHLLQHKYVNTSSRNVPYNCRAFYE